MIVSIPNDHKSSKYIQEYRQYSLNFQRKPYGEKGKQTLVFNTTATKKGFARKVSLGSGYSEVGGHSALCLPAPGGWKQRVLLQSRGAPWDALLRFGGKSFDPSSPSQRDQPLQAPLATHTCTGMLSKWASRQAEAGSHSSWRSLSVILLEKGREERRREDTANGLLTCLHTAPWPKKCKKNNHRVTKKYLVLLKGRRRCLFF